MPDRYHEHGLIRIVEVPQEGVSAIYGAHCPTSTISI
jgi:hypothetical protein